VSIELRNKVAELERRVAQLEAQQGAQVPGQVHQDQAVVNVPPEIARATLTLPEKRKSA
jgi:hypothetical protein